MYINKRIKHMRAKPALSGVIDDALCKLFGGCTTIDQEGAPVIDVTGSPEQINTGPTVQVSTIGGQVSSIPSSQAGGGYTTIGGFVSVGGVCKPTDSTSLSKFKELQRQANRVADAIGATKIGVDGAIGGQTLALMATIKTKAAAADTGSQGWGNFIGNQNISTCSAVAGGTDNLIPMLSLMADALGVSSSVASPAPASPPQIYNPITGQVSSQGLAADVGDLFGNMSTPTKIAALGIAGGIGYFLYKETSSKKARRA
jgi:hypothetical protein